MVGWVDGLRIVANFWASKTLERRKRDSGFEKGKGEENRAIETDKEGDKEEKLYL